MTATKTNERPGTKAILRHSRMSSTKAREVLDLIRGMEYTRARDVVIHLDRGAAVPIGKLLHSCAANAEHNDGLDPTELYVASCFADEGTTLKRWRPRARGRATRIRKRTCHITIILARMPEDRLARQRAKSAAEQADRRARRVAGGRRREAAVTTSPVVDHLTDDDTLLTDDGEAESIEIESTWVPDETTVTPEVDDVAGDVADGAEVEAAVDDVAEENDVTEENVAEENVAEENVAEENVAVENDTDATASEVAEDADASGSSAEEGAN